MKGYIKINEPKFPQTLMAIRNLSDRDWKEHIIFYLLKCNKEIERKKIIQIIQIENTKKIAEIETALKEYIKKWFRMNEDFAYNGFILNRETTTEGEITGFYDLKFEHSYWNDTHSYFAFECKNLGKSKSMSISKSIAEYIYIKKNNRIDGGIYRYMTGKYSANQKFGGMIGFLIGEIDNSIIEELIKNIYDVYDSNSLGLLTKEKIIRKSFFENSSTFDSIHIRQNRITKEKEDFCLHHLIMDFTNVNNN